MAIRGAQTRYSAPPPYIRVEGVKVVRFWKAPSNEPGARTRGDDESSPESVTWPCTTALHLTRHQIQQLLCPE